MTRRLFDVVVASVALVLTAPVLLAAIVAIRLETPGHPIYRQRRIGRDGRPFDMLKLRTMVAGAESMGSGLAVNEGDPRITRVGRVLRRLSLDELPQLWNVVRGDMSLIGPRPTLRYQVERYGERQRRRLDVKPGLTGWAQIKYPYGASIEDARQKLQYDLYYIKNQSLVLDAVILFETVKTILFGRGT